MTTFDPRKKLDELLRLPAETEWVEFKHNNDNPEEIGEYLTALSNGAALHRKDTGYIVWGVEDGTHRILGTSFQPRRAKVGNEALENWLHRLLTPRIDFMIHEFERDGSHPTESTQFNHSALAQRDTVSAGSLAI
jgi:predicted HTH transcriptional regulator